MTCSIWAQDVLARRTQQHKQSIEPWLAYVQPRYHVSRRELDIPTGTGRHHRMLGGKEQPQQEERQERDRPVQ